MGRHQQHSSPVRPAVFAFADVTTARAWSDSNHNITRDDRRFARYPQTSKSLISPSNPNACWDWWGFAGSDYDVQSGSQMGGIKKMIDRITSGHPALPAPADVHVTGVTNASIALAWDAVKGADAYQVQHANCSYLLAFNRVKCFRKRNFACDFCC